MFDDIYSSFFFVSQHDIIVMLLRASVRDGSRTAATSKMKLFVIMINGFQPLTIITKSSILDVATVLGPTLSVLGDR